MKYIFYGKNLNEENIKKPIKFIFRNFLFRNPLLFLHYDLA
jgi:hypothetical protein